jgi:hypothetical protein
MRNTTPPESPGQQSRPLVVFDDATGDTLLWIPALLCLALMILAMVF